MPMIKAGDKFNKLTAVKFVETRRNSIQYWLFKCYCGKEKVICVSSVKNGTIKSCGCYKKISLFKHGMVKTKTYYSWASMIQRCLNKNNPNYKHYGGRGINVCQHWLKFENFFEDMGEMPENKTLDRIENEKGYSKSNCKWSTRMEQLNNTRRNHFLTHKNKTQTIAQWSRELNINRHKILYRIRRGWSIKKILKTNRQK